MDSFQQIMSRAARQLRDLNVSQRLAIVLGGVLVAGSLVWLLQWAAKPEMTPLINMNLDAEEIARIRSGLEAISEPVQVVGSQVLVRASANRAALLAQLQQQERMPSDTSSGFDALVKEANPWISQEEHDRRWTVALQHEIERVLQQFPNVRQARVFLNLNTRNRGFSREQPASSASVTLIMQSGETVSRTLARAAARLVSGAVRGLPLKSVQVVDGGGVSALEWESEESSGPGGMHQLRRDFERQVAEKIRSQLAFDSKAVVNVQVELDLTTRKTDTVTPTDPVDISEERTTEESNRGGRSGQPGVQPNVGVVAGGGSSDETKSLETQKTEKVAGQKTQSESKPSGEIQSIFAAISISSSYLEGIVRREDPKVDKPSREQIQAAFDAQKDRLIKQLTVLVKPQSDEQVRVDWYYDHVDEPVAAPTGALDRSLELATRFGPQAGLGALALVALGLMFRMARQTDRGESFGLEIGLPKEAIDAARKAGEDVLKGAKRAAAASTPGGRVAGVAPMPPGATTVDYSMPGPVGQAAGTEGILEAREVDERTVQVSKMVNQLSDMAASDAATVTTLLEHWIRRKD